ncbi:MAG TPA: ribbon-helix-helix protein, CopG family [Bryobacteraceae bacterium]|nr:ribbon-helix-helix protein, CopG family [Bryobacteraceae bacterium]
MATRTTKVYSITMPPEMGRQAEQLAKEESRTMSELMREAFRRYQIERAERRLLADPMRSKHLAELRRLVTELREESAAKGLDRMSLRQIDAEIQAGRTPRAKKKGTKQPAR